MLLMYRLKHIIELLLSVSVPHQIRHVSRTSVRMNEQVARLVDKAWDRFQQTPADRRFSESHLMNSL